VNTLIRIKNLSVPFDDETSLKILAARRLKIAPRLVSEVKVARRALDCRLYRGAPVSWVYTLDVNLNESERSILTRHRRDKNIGLAHDAPQLIDWSKFSPRTDKRPIVVGFGPAGMLAAWALAKAGLNPLVLERGLPVKERALAVENFWRRGVLNPRGNAQFGEGGAGTFSDGKLTYRGDDPLCVEVLDLFINAGAPEEIRFLAKPHIGTDRLRKMVEGLREEIISLGGEVRFNCQVTDFVLTEGRVNSIIVNNSDEIKADAVFLAIGHSARDTYRVLEAKGVALEPKPFAVGVRIEHPQEFIDSAQYKEAAKTGKLPAADYRLTYNDNMSGRSAYSFCMCPGGRVVAAASESGQVVTNGMSVYARDSGAANAALVVNVLPTDFAGGALAGIRFQEQYEQAAFRLGGENFFAPVQSVGDFLAGKSGSKDFLLAPSYAPGVTCADLREALPPFVSRTLAAALPDFDRKIPGFSAADVPLVGVETRTSAPCRILRDRQTYESQSTPGLYPIGEGAGYAGGIMSAAIDGLRVVLSFFAGQRASGGLRGAAP